MLNLKKFKYVFNYFVVKIKFHTNHLVGQVLLIKETNPPLEQDSNPGLQLYARFRLRQLEESLSQARNFLLIDPHYPLERL